MYHNCLPIAPYLELLELKDHIFCLVLLIFRTLKISVRIETGPGRVVQLVRKSSCYSKVAGLISGQSTYKNQTVNASISEITN